MEVLDPPGARGPAGLWGPGYRASIVDRHVEHRARGYCLAGDRRCFHINSMWKLDSEKRILSPIAARHLQLRRHLWLERANLTGVEKRERALVLRSRRDIGEHNAFCRGDCSRPVPLEVRPEKLFGAPGMVVISTSGHGARHAVQRQRAGGLHDRRRKRYRCAEAGIGATAEVRAVRRRQKTAVLRCHRETAGQPRERDIDLVLHVLRISADDPHAAAADA